MSQQALCYPTKPPVRSDHNRKVIRCNSTSEGLRSQPGGKRQVFRSFGRPVARRRSDCAQHSAIRNGEPGDTLRETKAAGVLVDPIALSTEPTRQDGGASRSIAPPDCSPRLLDPVAALINCRLALRPGAFDFTCCRNRRSSNRSRHRGSPLHLG